MATTPFRVDNDEIRVGREIIHFLFSPEKLFSLALGGDISCDAYCRSFSHLIDDGLSPPRSQMDPAEERRETKRQKEYINMLGYVADSEYGIPRRCACGGRMIDEVRGNEEYDTLPGKRFFTCKNYEADGLHYRQPWVIGVQEEIKHLIKRVEEAEQVITGVPNLNKQIEILEEHVTILSGQVDNLTVQVADLEKSCQPIDVESSEVPRFSIQRSEDPKPVERRKQTPKEDILLISAWLNTSKDPIVSNEQKAGAFWKRIEKYFNSIPQLSGVAPRE
uniref:Uncharacterized protein n=1 Tax=Brassica oleracea var. oleracea TaxID=109376 RepID=A0A0D3A8F6_BRAOL